MVEEHSNCFLNGRAASSTSLLMSTPALALEESEVRMILSLTGRISLLSLALRFFTSLRHYKPSRFCIIAISSWLAGTYQGIFLLTPEPAEPDSTVRWTKQVVTMKRLKKIFPHNKVTTCFSSVTSQTSTFWWVWHRGLAGALRRF